MDSPGIEPGAFCMQNRRDTTTLQTLSVIYIKVFYIISLYAFLLLALLHTQLYPNLLSQFTRHFTQAKLSLLHI